MSIRHKLGLVLGISVFIIVMILPIPENMNPKAMKALAVSSMMAIFWVTEAISIIATSFIPIVLFPLLGILNADHIAASYGHHIVLLIIGAFFVVPIDKPPKYQELKIRHRWHSSCVLYFRDASTQYKME